MSELLAATIAGYGDSEIPPRSASTWLRESMDWLALLATHRTYDRNPALWKMGEQGRARTHEDFTHHLRAALGGDNHWRKHLDYTVQLFDSRGFPQRWLLDALQMLIDVLTETFPDEVTAAVVARLAAGPGIVAEIAQSAGIDLHQSTAYDDAVS